MPFYDCHCHSNHSHDSKMTLREIADNAIKLGFSGIAITNHFDPLGYGLNPERTPADRLNVLKAYSEITALKSEYAGRLELLCGIEIGSPFLFRDAADELANDSRVDEVIASVHRIKPIFDDGSSHPYSAYYDEPVHTNRLIEAYFTDIYRNIAFCDCDTVAHISYIQRYIVKEGAEPYDLKKYIDACADVLCAAIKRDKAIEINAKSISQCKNAPYSELDFFRLYRDLGGRLVTIGTDAHNLCEFDNARLANELLKAAGFATAYYYKGREPIEYSLN